MYTKDSLHNNKYAEMNRVCFHCLKHKAFPMCQKLYQVIIVSVINSFCGIFCCGSRVSF